MQHVNPALVACKQSPSHLACCLVWLATAARPKLTTKRRLRKICKPTTWRRCSCKTWTRTTWRPSCCPSKSPFAQTEAMHCGGWIQLIVSQSSALRSSSSLCAYLAQLIYSKQQWRDLPEHKARRRMAYTARPLIAREKGFVLLVLLLI